MIKSKTKRALFFLALIFNVLLCYSQSNKFSVNGTGGIAQEGFGGKLSFNYYSGEKDFIQASLLATFSEDTNIDFQDINYENYLLNIGYFKTIFSTRNKYFIVSIGGGASVGYESVNDGITNLTDGSILLAEDQFIYGGFAGLDLDIYLSDTISFIIEGNSFYHFGSDIGNVTAYAGGGVRLYIN